MCIRDRFQTDAGALAAEFVVASTPQSEGGLIFFAFTQETEFSTVTVRAKTVGDGLGIDGVYVVRAAGTSIPGDINMDGVVNFLDIAPFINILATQ